jgi:hypothetical protein
LRAARVLAVLTTLSSIACSTDPTSPDAKPDPKPETRTFDVLAATSGGYKNAAKSKLSGYTWAWDNQGGPGGSVKGGRMFAETVLGVGINEHAKVTSYVSNTIDAKPARYRLSAEVSWRGYLYGVGVAGTGAEASFVMRVTDGAGRALVSPVTIASKEVRDKALSVGGTRHEGKATPVVEFTLPEGQSSFKVQFELTCETWGGFLSAEGGCLYGVGKVAKLIGLGGFARWDRLTVTMNP